MAQVPPGTRPPRVQRLTPQQLTRRDALPLVSKLRCSRKSRNERPTHRRLRCNLHRLRVRLDALLLDLLGPSAGRVEAVGNVGAAIGVAVLRVSLGSLTLVSSALLACSLRAARAPPGTLRLIRPDTPTVHGQTPAGGGGPHPHPSGRGNAPPPWPAATRTACPPSAPTERLAAMGRTLDWWAQHGVPTPSPAPGGGSGGAGPGTGPPRKQAAEGGRGFGLSRDHRDPGRVRAARGLGPVPHTGAAMARGVGARES